VVSLVEMSLRLKKIGAPRGSRNSRVARGRREDHHQTCSNSRYIVMLWLDRTPKGLNETILICDIDRERFSFRPSEITSPTSMIPESCTTHFLARPPPPPGNLFRLRIRSQRPDGLSCPPDLLVVNLFQLALKIFAVGLAAVKLKRLPGLGTILHRLVQRLEYRPVRLLKYWSPVECTAASSCRAGLRAICQRGSVNGD
jgi:hypothetical protein